MSGLALSIGLDRKSVLNYEKKDKFVLTIRKARDTVHADVEKRLMDGAGVGAIFNLKNNFGWKDKTEVEQTNFNHEIPEINIKKSYNGDKPNDKAN